MFSIQEALTVPVRLTHGPAPLIQIADVIPLIALLVLASCLLNQVTVQNRYILNFRVSIGANFADLCLEGDP